MANQQRSTFNQTNAYAMQLGAGFGIYWCLGFICMIGGFSNPILHLLLSIILISTPFVGISLARYFERQVRQDGVVRFGRAWWFSFLLYFYACIILCLVAYIYFQFFDKGMFVSNYIAHLNLPENKQILEAPEFKQQLEQMLSATGFSNLEEVVRNITPTMFVANILDINTLLAAILAAPTALVSKTPNKYLNNQ